MPRTHAIVTRLKTRLATAQAELFDALACSAQWKMPS